MKTELVNSLIRFVVAGRKGVSPRLTRMFVTENILDWMLNSNDHRNPKGFVYNGEYIKDCGIFTTQMTNVSNIIQGIVQEDRLYRCSTKGEVTNLPDHKLSLPEDYPWKPNVAAINCYRNGNDGTGYHSDRLNHIGPNCIIAGLTLGASRIFRLRRKSAADEILMSQSSASNEESEINANRTVSIQLPHNSLLIMGPGCQEV